MSFFQKILDYQAQGKVYVIAEVGSNWKTHQDLMGAVTLAKNCGADAVKFQFFTDSELYGPKPEIDKTFPLNQLKEKCDATGIDFLCSTFSPEGLKEADKFLPAHKIASSEMSHVRLLDAAKASGKPIILSTGAYFGSDIKRVLNFLGDHPTIVMHCNVSYPAKHVNLKKLAEIKTFFSGPLGFSDHTTSVDSVPKLMKSEGVCVYEKHFNPFGYTTTPDAPHSLEREEFKALVQTLRGSPSEFNEEDTARLRYVRRIIALKDIRPGDRLKEGDNIGIYRARRVDAKGANPFAIEKLEGKAATKVVMAGEGVSLLDIT